MITIILSVTSILLATASLHVAHNEYKYKLDPTYEVTTQVYIQADEKGEIHIVPESFDVKFEKNNNLKEVYIISPKFLVSKMEGKNYSKEITEYFITTYESHMPDFETQNGKYKYYYQFMVYYSLDDEIEVKLLYLKTEPIQSEFVPTFTFNEVNSVNLIEFDNAHGADPYYEGERIMAKKYKEILEYYKQLA